MRVVVARRWLLLPLLLAGCTHAAEGPRVPRPGRATATDDGDLTRAPPSERSDTPSDVATGMATWYGGKLAGHKTASGERFDPSQMTAAHRTLPLGTWVEVTRVDTGKSVRVRINDRGPFGHADRIIDLSRAAADQLDMVRAGVAEVRVRVVDGP
jgi:rare lipoprotein A